MAVQRKLSLLLLVLPLVMLTGCLRYLADYEIVNNDEVTLRTDVAVLTSAAEEMGGDAPDFCADSAYAGNANATLEPYSDEEYTGCRITLTGSVSEVADGNTTIELADGVWAFRQNNEGQEDAVDSAEMFSDFRISVTFPGEVLEHSGSSTVSGRTVTWTDPVDFVAGDGVYATGRDSSGGGTSAWVWWVVGIVGGVAVLAVAVVLVVRVRKPKNGPPSAPPSGPPTYGGVPPGSNRPPAGTGYPQPGVPGQQQPGGSWPPSPPHNPFRH